VTVAVFSPRYAPDPGGIERLLSHVLPMLTAHGHEFVVVTGTDDASEKVDVIDGIHVYRMPFDEAIDSGRPGDILHLARRLRDVELMHDVDVRHIHGFGDIGLWFALRCHQRRPCPLAISVHGTLDSAGPIATMARTLLCSAMVVSVVSDAVRSSVLAVVPEVSHRVRLIRNGLPSQATTPRPWARGPLVAVGRLEHQKGFDVALDALALLDESCTDIDLVIVGNGSRRDDLRSRAARLGLAHRVRLVGQLPADGVMSVLNDASVVLVPARTMEGFSLVALEAAQMGRPVVASSVGGLAETVEDGVTGMIVPPEDPAALAAAAETLLRDPERARAMGRAGQRRAATHFDLACCVKAYDQLYRDLYACARPLATLGAEGGRD